MTNENFEKMDESLMKGLKEAREKKVPPKVLKGFSASVEARIRENQPAVELQTASKRSFVPAWAPVFAVLVITLAVVLRNPSQFNPSAPISPVIQIASANVSDISEEIATLRELEVWTDEDERSIGVLSENSADELELTRRPIPSVNSLA